MSRWLSPLMAFCLSFMIIASLAPSLDIQLDRQIDFWILWLVTMLILALPIAYLEVALAKRSKTTALNALSSLTREADTFQSWRVVGWLAVVFIPFLAGGILSNINQTNQASKTALPIWGAQLIAVITFGFFAVSTQIPAYTLLVTAVISAALLLQLAKEQLAQRQVAVVIQFIILLVTLFVWAIPNTTILFNSLLMLWGLVICFIYSIFVGWIMKISHLRKAINFSSEVLYNIWRIAVRIVLPLAIVVAMISYIGQWF